MDVIWGKAKSDILDPLSAIIKLYICSHKPSNTKFSVVNNRVSIQCPGTFQGIIRKYNGDKKNDIPILTMPVLYACNTYLLADKDKYYFIFQSSLNALDKIKSTYQGNEIVYNIDTLKNYISSFMDTINNTTMINEIDEKIINGTDSVSKIYNSKGGKLKRNMYEIISTIWTDNRISTVFNMIDEIEKEETTGENKDILIDTLSMYMHYMDELAHNQILGLA